ncbi:CDP-alcohol phosphatidyltransferase family protein [Methylotetracoccus oryzae]|uniref:CDP-alcohol phosphatidyltransferase family protein n=1 Tax=Methylotetracoccus oryzae TaxID=1919059 RepID=UPI00111AFBE8|nr:CDP-alcohol phosphatidyltransferase family protein [Methylotetracoccus oryzae]
MGPLSVRDIPNLITFFRIVLVGPVILTMTAGRFDWALGLFILAGVSDAIDGFLAKYFHWQSRLGSFLDPIADKLLLVSCYVTLGLKGLAPLWLVGAIVLRDLVIVAGAIAYYRLSGPYEGRPLLISKLNTLLQLSLVVALLFDQGLHALPSWGLDAMIYGTLFTTVASGAQYVLLWGRSYWRHEGPA